MGKLAVFNFAGNKVPPRRRPSLVVLLDQLVDEVADDESHPLASLMEIVSLLAEKYEDEQVPELKESTALREDPPVTQTPHSTAAKAFRCDAEILELTPFRFRKLTPFRFSTLRQIRSTPH